MKSALILLLIMLASHCYAQVDTTKNLHITEPDYHTLRVKAKCERITGIVCLSGGGGLVAGGLLTMFIATFGSLDKRGTTDGTTSNVSGEISTGAIIAAVGGGICLTSIYFFHKAHLHNREAKLLLRSNTLNLPLNNRYIALPQINVGFSISLGH
jgi:hypothetical protein